MIITDLRRRVAWLIGIRAIVSTILLGGAIVAQVTAPGSFPVNPFFFLVALTYGLTIVYALTLRFVDRYHWLIDIQLAIDAVVVSAFIYFTGGITSYVSSLYVLPIVAASVVRFRRGGLFVACASAVLYVAIVFTQFLTAAGILIDPWLSAGRVVLPTAGTAQYTVATQPVRVLRGGAAERLAGGQGPIGRRAARAGVDRDRRPAGVEPARHRQPAERPGHDRSPAAHPDVQSRGRGDHRAGVRRRWSGARSRKCCSCRNSWPGRSTSGTCRPRPAGDSSSGTGAATIAAKSISGSVSRTCETPGGRAGYLITFQDVTDIKKLERDARLQQRLAAVGEMAAGIAHEIRNPLASMSGSIQILRQELPLSAEQEQLMDIVLRESERLNSYHPIVPGVRAAAAIRRSRASTCGAR